MSFVAELDAWPRERVAALYDRVTEADVLAALGREERTVRDLAALLSPAARPHLERMAREAQRLTRWHFGRTISLYAPIYFSNLCAADCLYCGFAVCSGVQDERVTLTDDQIEAECIALKNMGYDNVLLLTGEAPKAVPPAHIARAVSIARRHFSGISVEVYSMDEPDYALLCDSGLEGVTLYQETYDRELYSEVHPRGLKRDYEYRVDTLERAGNAGVRKTHAGRAAGPVRLAHRPDLDGHARALPAKALLAQCRGGVVPAAAPHAAPVPRRLPHVRRRTGAGDSCDAAVPARGRVQPVHP